MIKYIKYIVFLSVTTGLFACGNDSQHAEEHEHHDHQEAELTAQSDMQFHGSAEFNEDIERATEQYFMLSAALVEDNVEDAARHSAAMREILADADADELNEQALNFWSEQWGTINTRARALEEEIDIEAQRFEFEFLSDAMIELIEGFDPLSFDVYIQRCPMVRDGSADWVSRSEDILNPYHGDRMLTCGSVIRKI